MEGKKEQAAAERPQPFDQASPAPVWTRCFVEPLPADFFQNHVPFPGSMEAMMQCHSARFNGWWKAAGTYYAEILNDGIQIRDHSRKLLLDTRIAYDRETAERGEKTEIVLLQKDLWKHADGTLWHSVKSLIYENDALLLDVCMHYGATEKHASYTLQKTEQGPFSHMICPGPEALKGLSGEWYTPDCETGRKKLTITGDMLHSQFLIGCDTGVRFRAVSYVNEPDRVFLVPRDLAEPDFHAFTPIEVLPDSLRLRRICTGGNNAVYEFRRPPKIPVPPKMTRFSEKLNGWWDSGEHFYFELLDDRLTVRDYNLNPLLTATIRYDAYAPERGENTRIIPSAAIFTYAIYGKNGGREQRPVTIREIQWENGALKLRTQGFFNTDLHYTFQKLDGAPDPAQPRFCPECLFPFDEGTPRFCPNCGRRIK